MTYHSVAVARRSSCAETPRPDARRSWLPHPKPSAWANSTTWSNNSAPVTSRVAVEVVAARLPHPRQRVAHGELVRVVAEDERATEVRLPFLEDRPQVQERDVVFGDHAVRWMLLERLQGVLTGPHDAPMPVPALTPSRSAARSRDLVGQFLLADTRADQPTLFDLVEQLRGLGLGIQQPLRADTLVGHRIDATAGRLRPTERSRDAPACSSPRE